MSEPPLRDLRAFEAVARLASLGAAAAELGLSQPSVTETLARLERQVGHRLLQRGPRGSFPTPAGERFLRRVLRCLQRMEAAVAALAGGPAPARKLTAPQLRAHLAIAETGGFAAAARALGIGPPSLNRAARSLERLLGVALYRRGEAGFRANPAGAEFARQIALARLEIEQGLAEANPGAGGRLALGALPLVPRQPLASAVMHLAAVPGAPALLVVEGNYQDLAIGLRAGRLDAIIGSLRAPPPYPDLVEQPLVEDPFAVAVRADHPLVAGGITPAALAATRWVVPGADLPRRRVVEALFATLPARPPVVLETSSLELTLAVLRGGRCRGLALRAADRGASGAGRAAGGRAGGRAGRPPHRRADLPRRLAADGGPGAGDGGGQAGLWRGGTRGGKGLGTRHGSGTRSVDRPPSTQAPADVLAQPRCRRRARGALPGLCRHARDRDAGGRAYRAAVGDRHDHRGSPPDRRDR
ncbi:LysR family transcriptional regulator [Humitalea sp. 24SJ18S-53]|uniref:LysR family transcriptional regulator n=1 Tax=Humitalea sp. 24SJ18S-53 TaxID=3422307 RepID=UPI003D675DAF